MQEQNIQSAEEYASLMADIEWLSTEYAPIKERAIDAEIRRKRIEDRLRKHDLIGLFE
jgi:hypothetical protein